MREYKQGGRNVSKRGNGEVMLIQTLETGQGVVGVTLRAGITILIDRGMRLRSSPPIVA